MLVPAAAGMSLVAVSSAQVAEKPSAPTKPENELRDRFTEKLPIVIDDDAVVEQFVSGFGALIDSGKAHTCPKLLNGHEKLSTMTADRSLVTFAGDASGNDEKKDAATLYRESVDSTLLIGSLYKCGRCDNWHAGAMATAWVAGESGVVVTNYHVLEGKDDEHFLGVMTRDGKAYPVTDVLAGDRDADVALLRVDTGGEKMKPLTLGPSADIGSDVVVISNPRRRFFVLTKGAVSRYFHNRISRDRGLATQMGITADYAVGSSGGPVIDSNGHVVGMVSSTQTVHAGHKHKEGEQSAGDVQMVFKDCVPVAAIKALVDDPHGK